MKILISITNLEVGGAQLFALNFANYLSERHDVYIYDHRPEDRITEFVSTRLNKKIKLVSFSHNIYSLKVIWKINKLIKKVFNKFSFRDFIHEKHFSIFLKKKQFDIIHSHLAYSDFIVAKHVPANFPFIITVHGCYDQDVAVLNDEYVINARKNIKLILKKVKAIVYLTEKSKYPFLDLQSPTSQVIFKKIDNALFKNHNDYLERKDGIDQSFFVFGMVARGIKEKGWEEALIAFNEAEEILLKKSIKSKFIAVGGGTFLDDLKEQYHQFKNIIFVGEVPDALVDIQFFDVGILPSYRECFPNVIMEYIELNKPVIASSVGDIPYMLGIENNPVGILIKNDSNGHPNLKELRDAMVEMAVNNSKFTLFQNNCLEQKKIFSVERCIHEYELIYNRIK